MRTRFISAVAVSLLAAVGGGAVLTLAASAPASAEPCADCEPGEGGLPRPKPASCKPITNAGATR